MHAFGQECLQKFGAGALSGAVVAEAHVEHSMTLEYVNDSWQYLARPRVREELREAAVASVWHPTCLPSHGWVQAHPVFAYALHQGGAYAAARPHFTALGNRVAGNGA